jgi:bacillithiol biosynthesis cysteine-adding enzyme BshC
VSQARVVTRSLGGSALAELAARGDGSAFFPPRPQSVRAWRARMQEAREQAPPNWMSIVSPALGGHSPARERLERVAHDGGVLVTTGQQPGLFGGPIYSWSKAISALAVADALEGATGIPTAPLFWAATDDADYAEASVTHVATRDGLVELRLPPPPREGAAMAEQPLGDVAGLVGKLTLAAGSAAYDMALAAVRAAYEGSSTVGGAYVALMRKLLEPLGISILDASDASIRAASRPLLVLALRGAAKVETALVDRERALRAAGYEPQVRHVPELSLVFEYANGTKRRVPVRRAIAVSEDDDAALGPNVLLRPILERVLLPTVAYTAGPGELAYFAQVSAVASTLGTPMPLGVPRWSGVIVEPYVDRILERYGLTMNELVTPHAVLKRLVAERVSSGVTQSLVDMRDELHRTVEVLRRALSGDPRPLVDDRVVDGAQRQLMHRVNRIERRILAAAKRRESELTAQIEAAHVALYPLGQPQERVLNLIPILAREGPGLLTAMRRAAGDHAASLLHPTSGVAGASEHRATSIAK